MSKNSICLLLGAAILLISVSGIAAQCSQGQTPNVCRYGTNLLNGLPGTNTYNTCAAINQNPFAVKGVFSGAVSADACATYAREDGTDCIEFYAELQCAGGCQECGRGICPYFCNNFADICPTATENNCFQFISCEDTGACSKWPISTSDLPDPIKTTSSSTTRTTTTGTGTGTSTTTDGGDDSGVAQLSICAFVVIFAFFSVFA